MKTFINTLFLGPLLIAVSAFAEIPSVLTDNIKNGDGVIDIFKDATGAELEEYLQSGTLYLGVDLNEAASENESSTTAGVAIKEMELIIRTTEGDFSYTEFYTNTTAMILEEGTTEAQEYNTLFGSAGGSDITGSTSNFNLSAFDDVIILENIQFDGEIIGADLRVTFLDTANAGENESFFDYSAGFEEFAILSSTDATTLDSANIGLGDAAPANISYSVDSPSGTPEPSWLFLAVIPVFLFLRQRNCAKSSK
jgi:hypothetical protein